MQNESLQELRDLARKRHIAVTKKVSRLRRKNEVELTATKYDPRRELAKIKHYNTAQLKSYINKLEGFTARDNQYLRGARGSVVTKKYWDEFQTAQRAVSKRNRAEFAKIEKIFIPRFNQTIGERIAMLAKPSRMGNNMATNRPFDEVARSARGLMGDKGAKIQAETMLNRLKPDWIGSRINRDRDNMRKMASVINETRLLRLVDTLTNNQFNVLWNYTGFATAYSMNYENVQKMLSAEDEAWHNTTADDAVEDSHALIEWIKTLDLG